jgi:hypothetical protein
MLLLLGDVIKLKQRFRSPGGSGIGIIIDIDSFEGPGWVGYDYIMMMTDGQINRITESCVEEIYTSALILQTAGSAI